MTPSDRLQSIATQINEIARLLRLETPSTTSPGLAFALEHIASCDLAEITEWLRAAECALTLREIEAAVQPVAATKVWFWQHRGAS